MNEVILEQAIAFYETGQDQRLIQLAESIWPQPDDELPSGIAEVCRYARIATRRQRDFVAQEVWAARALTAAVLTDVRDTAAGLLLPHFFGLVEEGAYEAAREVLGEMARLITPDHPRSRLFMRLYHEKLAYSFLAEEQFEQAQEQYSTALVHCAADDDPRGVLKVQGGAALASYLSRCVDTKACLDEMERILSEAKSQGFADVVLSAEQNIDLMNGGEYGGWHPFEVT